MPAGVEASKRGILALAASLAMACSSRPDPVVSEPFPVPTDTTPPTIASRISPRAVVGTYQGDVVLSNAATRQRGRGRSTRTQIRLESGASAVPAEGSTGTQYNATVILPGYTRAPRGRTAQSAAWWPGPMDSVVVQFTGQQGSQIQMRGSVAGNRITGEIWYTSLETGSSFQLGTFTTTKVRARNRE
jgi:hypothetical protein